MISDVEVIVDATKSHSRKQLRHLLRNLNNGSAGEERMTAKQAEREFASGEGSVATSISSFLDWHFVSLCSGDRGSDVIKSDGICSERSNPDMHIFDRVTTVLNKERAKQHLTPLLVELSDHAKGVAIVSQCVCPNSIRFDSHFESETRSCKTFKTTCLTLVRSRIQPQNRLPTQRSFKRIRDANRFMIRSASEWSDYAVASRGSTSIDIFHSASASTILSHTHDHTHD